MSALQNRQVWLGGGAIAAVVITAAAWFFVISPELSSASSLNDEKANAETQNITIQHKNATLAKQFEHIGALQNDLTKALEALPSDSGLPSFTREVTGAAASNQISVSGISVGSVAIVAPATPAASPEASSTPTPAATTAATGATSGAGSQFSIGVTVVSHGSYTHQVNFLEALEHGARRTIVTSNQVTVAGTSRVSSVDAGTTMTTQLTIFSAPITAAQLTQLQKISNRR